MSEEKVQKTTDEVTEKTTEETKTEVLPTVNVEDDKKTAKAAKVVKSNLISPYDVKPGMIVKLFQKIKEVTPKGETKERLQFFEGTIIARKGGSETGATMTIRKISNGVGVEKIFPLALPTIEKIELLSQVKTRRAKLYFLRGGYKKKLKKVKVA